MEISQRKLNYLDLFHVNAVTQRVFLHTPLVQQKANVQMRSRDPILHAKDLFFGDLIRDHSCISSSCVHPFVES
jgi:hypothetical protein